MHLPEPGHHRLSPGAIGKRDPLSYDPFCAFWGIFASLSCPRQQPLQTSNTITSLVIQRVKNPLAMQKTWVQSLDQEDALEKGMATYPSIFA